MTRVPVPIVLVAGFLLVLSAVMAVALREPAD